MSRSQAVTTGRVGLLLPAPTRPARTWHEYLREANQQAWRPDEFDPVSGLWHPDPSSPRNVLQTCRRPGCTAPTAGTGPRGICNQCNGEMKAQGWTKDQILTTPVSEPRSPARNRPEQCLVVVEGVACSHNARQKGLCRDHYGIFKTSGQRDPKAWASVGVGNRGEPLRLYSHADCMVPRCPRTGHRIRAAGMSLCPSCRLQMRNKIDSGEARDAADWLLRYAEPQDRPPFVVDFALLPSDLVRDELLFVLRGWDAQRAAALDSVVVMAIIRRARAAQIETLVNPDWVSEAAPRLGRAAAFSTFLNSTLGQAYRRFSGYDPAREDVLYLEDLPLREITSSPKPSRAEVKALDLNAITQPWLREGFRKWVLTELDTRNSILIAYSTVCRAGEALKDHRADHGVDGSRLGLEDMTVIVRAIHQTLTAEGASGPNSDTVRGRLRFWWRVVNSARRLGVWDDIPATFARDPRFHANVGVKTDRGELGRALPPSVVIHLRSHTNLVASANWGDMKVTALNVLIDTGRRPNEIVSLHRDCLYLDPTDSGWWLKWDNHKSKRMDRRLPIDSETAEVIQRWQDTLDRSGSTSKWLFPTLQKNAGAADKHVNSQWLITSVKELTSAVPPITAPVIGIDGSPVPVNLASITPYDFRHSYAQRMADAGVPVDVLKELMDHENPQTTMQYYTVTAKRKRDAAQQVAPLTLDRLGNHVDMEPERQGLSTVAVPYGGCAEPSNINAGGVQCPVRFQCAACNFYRPDPSYLPEMERLIADLKMNLAAARKMGQPQYVLDNFRGQIEDYQRILSQMIEDLAALSDDERAEIEFASTVLRRARAAEAQGLSLLLGNDPIVRDARLRAASRVDSGTVLIPTPPIPKATA